MASTYDIKPWARTRKQLTFFCDSWQLCEWEWAQRKVTRTVDRAGLVRLNSTKMSITWPMTAFKRRLSPHLPTQARGSKRKIEKEYVSSCRRLFECWARHSLGSASCASTVQMTIITGAVSEHSTIGRMRKTDSRALSNFSDFCPVPCLQIHRSKGWWCPSW